MTSNITATYIGGKEVNGRVTFIPDADAVLRDDGIVIKDRYEAWVVDGQLSIALPDNETGNPTGWSYKVIEDFRGGRIYHIEAPAGDHKLEDLAPVPTDNGNAVVVGPPGQDGKGFGQVIAVEDYATGDGATNDTAAINAALADLAAVEGPKALLFPAHGVYLIDGLVTSNLSDFTIIGNGAKLVLSRPRTDAPLVNTHDVWLFNRCSDFTVTGLEIDGNRHCDVAWPTYDHAPVTQYLVSGAASGSSTFKVQDGTKFVVGERLWVCGGLGTDGHDNRDDNDQRGLAVSAINGNTLTLEEPLTHNYTSGAYVTSYQSSGGSYQLEDFTIGNEDQQNGLHLIRCERFTVEGNTISNVWESPIKLGIGFVTPSSYVIGSGGSHGLVRGNRVFVGYDQGISVWNATHITVSENTISDTGWAGISLTQSDECTVTNNDVSETYYRIPGDNDSGSGIVIEGGRANLVSENRINNVWSSGLYTRESPLGFGVDGGNRPKLTDNADWGGTTIKLSHTDGLVVGAPYSLLRNGYTQRIVVASIVDSEHITVTVPLRYSARSGDYLDACVAEDNLFIDNMVTGTQNGDAIHVLRSCRTTIKGGQVTDSNHKAILIEHNDYHGADFEPGGSIVDSVFFARNGVNGGECIYIDQTDGVTIRNCIVNTHNSGNGIKAVGSRDLVLEGNRASRVRSDAIQVESTNGRNCDRAIIRGNRADQNDGKGFNLKAVIHGLVQGNYATANAGGGGGINFEGSTNTTISNNFAIANEGSGIKLDASSIHNIVTGNTALDDGSGHKGSDDGALAQSQAIVETGGSDYNQFIANIVDVPTVISGANSSATDLTV